MTDRTDEEIMKADVEALQATVLRLISCLLAELGTDNARSLLAELKIKGIDDDR